MQPANQAVEGIASIAVRCPVFSLYGDQRDSQENTNMAKELTHDQVRELFDYRDGNLYWAVARQGINGGDIAGTVRKDGYRSIQIDDKNYLAHRLVFLYHHGFLPEFLDHIDGDRLNNDISNLREATIQENNRCAKKAKSYGGKQTSSIFKGVCWNKHREKWLARITIDSKQKYLGSFISEIDAAEAYNRSAIELFGGFAYLNIISQPLDKWGVHSMTKNEFKPPEPIEDKDYYKDELYEYTVCIELCVRGLEESYSEADTCSDAVDRFKNGMIDGDATVVNSEYIKDVELDWDTDEPFDRDGWVKAKLAQIGVRADGSPVRSGEKPRPTTEKLLSDFR